MVHCGVLSEGMATTLDPQDVRYDEVETRHFSKSVPAEAISTDLTNFTSVNEGFLVVMQACEWWLPPLYHGRGAHFTPVWWWIMV